MSVDQSFAKTFQGCPHAMEVEPNSTLRSGPISMVFNLDRFLQRLMDDEDLACEVALRFLEDLPGLLAELKEHAARSHPENIRRSAHKLKGSAANVGGERLRDLAFALESEARTGDDARTSQLVSELETQASIFSDALRIWAA